MAMSSYAKDKQSKENLSKCTWSNIENKTTYEFWPFEAQVSQIVINTGLPKDSPPCPLTACLASSAHWAGNPQPAREGQHRRNRVYSVRGSWLGWHQLFTLNLLSSASPRGLLKTRSIHHWSLPTILYIYTHTYTHTYTRVCVYTYI